MNTLNRFRILHRDGFRCAYCGAQPGNDRLQVDHLVPQSWGGSDHDDNLVTACDRCNNGKSDSMHVPPAMCDGTIDYDGWTTWKRWGNWSLKISPYGDDPVISIGSGFCEYWIPLGRVHEPDWEDHMREKSWMCEGTAYDDFLAALAFARLIVVKVPIGGAA